MSGVNEASILLVTDPDVVDYIVWVHFVYCLTSN